MTLAGGLGALLLHRLGRVGSVRRPGPDLLLAGGRGHSGTLGEPFGASKWPDEGRNPRLRSQPRPSQQVGRETERRHAWSTERDDGDRRQEAAETSERVRRIALGLTAALITARAFWPSEPDLREGAGSGLYWVFVVFIAFGLALTSALVGGRFRFRWSWTDAMVVGLMVLVAVSASHALDRRPAINLAWEWVALGLIYLLLRNLPRTRDESSALAGVMVATAFAVSVYGLYQLTVELPLIRAEYLRNPQADLAKAGYRTWRTRRGAVQEPPGGFDRGVFDVWPGQFAGGFYRRSARGRSGGCVPEPGRSATSRNRGGRPWSWRPRSFLFCSSA